MAEAILNRVGGRHFKGHSAGNHAKGAVHPLRLAAAAKSERSDQRAAFVDAMCMLNNRVNIFINLPIASPDRLSLQARLDNIGQPASEPAREPG